MKAVRWPEERPLISIFDIHMSGLQRYCSIKKEHQLKDMVGIRDDEF
jgi:hypothetical protein